MTRIVKSIENTNFKEGKPSIHYFTLNSVSNQIHVLYEVYCFTGEFDQFH